MVRFRVNDFVSGKYLTHKVRHSFGLVHLNMDVYSTLNYNWGKRQKIEYLHIIYYSKQAYKKCFRFA